MGANVFITGASSGIGAALARQYATNGARLGLVARRADALDRLAAELTGRAPCEIACWPADVADASAMQQAAHAHVARFGLPEIVIANAGISVGTLGGDERDLPVLERVWRTNVLGLAATLQPFVEPMRARGSGALVGIASVAGFRGLPGSGAYSSSKAAAISWLESLRVELHGSGVAVCTICPGYVESAMTAVNQYPMPFILPADVAARRMAKVIARRRACTVVPWQMGVVGVVLRHLPTALYDRLFARAPRKARSDVIDAQAREPR